MFINVTQKAIQGQGHFVGIETVQNFKLWKYLRFVSPTSSAELGFHYLLIVLFFKENWLNYRPYAKMAAFLLYFCLYFN